MIGRPPPIIFLYWVCRDDNQSRAIGELSFRTSVRAVRLRRDRIVAVTDRKVYVYNFSDLKLLDQIETTNNERGVVALSWATSNPVLVVPGRQKGYVRIDSYHLPASSSAASSASASSASAGANAIAHTKLIRAHDTALAAVALSRDALKLVTASVQGTLIRVFDVGTGLPLQVG
jgi:WD40 repeat protein